MGFVRGLGYEKCLRGNNYSSWYYLLSGKQQLSMHIYVIMIP